MAVGLAVGAADQGPRACHSARGLTGRERDLRFRGPGTESSNPAPSSKESAANLRTPLMRASIISGTSFGLEVERPRRAPHPASRTGSQIRPTPILPIGPLHAEGPPANREAPAKEDLCLLGSKPRRPQTPRAATAHLSCDSPILTGPMWGRRSYVRPFRGFARTHPTDAPLPRG